MKKFYGEHGDSRALKHNYLLIATTIIGIFNILAG